MGEILHTRVIAKAFATNSWILSGGGSGEALIVDPGIGEPYLHQAILERCRELKLKPVAAFLTHGHLDHIFSLTPLCDSADIPAYIHSKDRGLLTHPERALSAASKGLIPLGKKFVEPAQVFELTDAMKLSVAGLKLRFHHAPGHTPGSVIAEVDDELLISGDVLFKGSIGRTDLPMGSLRDMEVTLREKILPLPDHLLLLPGHGDESRMGVERNGNPYLRAAKEGNLR